MPELTVAVPGELTWSDTPAPAEPGPTAAVVRPIAVATCDFDHLVVAGLTPLQLPLVLGHECVAVVTQVGHQVTTIAPGDTVVVPFQVNCGACAMCRRGLTASCTAVPWLSGYGLGAAGGSWGGATADSLVVPWADAMLLPVPAGVDPADAAAASCNISDAYRCVSAVRGGEDVLVVGGAFDNIALYAVQLALALGAGTVDYLGPRGELAESLGARVIDRGEVIEGRYPVTVDASMDTHLLAAAIDATAPSGVCTVSTMYQADSVPIPLFTMFRHCLTLRTGQPHVRGVLDEVLGLIGSGAVHPRAVTSDVVDWQDAPKAFLRGSGKTVCVRPG